ncbi:MAG: phosphotransferase family protein [Ilumatobacteraceae bacterium]
MSVDDLGIRSDPERIETEWMSRVLDAAGLARGARLTDCRFGGYVGTGQTGCNARFHLTWDREGDRPATVMGKFPSRDATARATGFGGSAYITEWNFYRNIAPTLRVRAPHCYLSAFDGDAQEFCLIMEDLAGSEQGDHFIGLNDDEMALAIEQAVLLHGPRWGDSTLDASWPQPSTEDERSERLAMLYGFLLPAFLDRLGARLDSAIVGIVNDFAPLVGRWARGTGTPLTVAHYDFRPDNFLFARTPTAPPLVVVDWQTVNQGLGMVDVAYVIASSYGPGDRPRERDLVVEYHERLSAAGVSYSFDDCWRDYRFGALWGLIITVLATSMAAQTERGDDLFVRMASQYGYQSLELDSLELLRT